MEVILLERIEKLGQMGDIVKVKPGFARNYLLPQAKALRSNKENLALFESRKVQLEAANLKRKEEAEQISAKMEGLKLVIVRQAAETGQLYGSVTGRDIRDAIREAGYSIERRQVVLDQPLKEIGSFDIRIILHPDVSRMVNVMVARSAEEAERNAKAAAKAAANAAAEVAVVEEAVAAEA
ncbi:MAG: 50S ribosomal protein L9 [Alphaproteobacteria bacterium]|nr:50S ribosomal protein L9 [Alphaproteobacteria bacterium]